MVTFTANKTLGLPVVGGDAGVWGPPLNNNSSIIDASFGGLAVVPLSSVAGAITLLASNYNNVFISFTGAITQNTVVTFPSVGSFYTILNQTTGSSAFTVTLATSAVGGFAIAVPPGEVSEVYCNGGSPASFRFRALPHVGTYWDFAGSSVPNWVTACTVPPWLNCDGTAFSSATYPSLATYLGGTTLPDARGRQRVALNQGTGRITSSQGGVDGNTLLASGGAQTTTLSSQHVPPVPITDPGHLHSIGITGISFQGGAGTPFTLMQQSGATNTATATTGITAGSSSPTFFSNLEPTYVHGITMIRAG